MPDDAHVYTLGHSPDPDDAFMFYAMAEHKIDLHGYQFEHRLEDIQKMCVQIPRRSESRMIHQRAGLRPPKSGQSGNNAGRCGRGRAKAAGVQNM